MSKPVKIQPTYQLKTHISENKRTRRKSREWWSNGVRLRLFVFFSRWLQMLPYSFEVKHAFLYTDMIYKYKLDDRDRATAFSHHQQRKILEFMRLANLGDTRENPITKF